MLIFGCHRKENSFFLNTPKQHRKNPCRSTCSDSSGKILESTAIPRNDPTKNPRLRFTCSLGFSFAQAILEATPIALCATPALQEVSGVIGASSLKRLPAFVVREAMLVTLWIRNVGTIEQWHPPSKSCRFCFSND